MRAYDFRMWTKVDYLEESGLEVRFGFYYWQAKFYNLAHHIRIDALIRI